MMRAALPGTRHSSTLDSKERDILRAIQQAPGVRKLETFGFKWTGPKPRRLELRVAQSPGIRQLLIHGRLFIGSAMRRMVICPEPQATLASLSQELAAVLTKYWVEVVALGEENNMPEQQVQTRECQCSQSVLTPEERWSYCEQIYQGVKTVKEYEELEMELELRLEELRGKRQETQQHTMDILAYGVARVHGGRPGDTPTHNRPAV